MEKLVFMASRASRVISEAYWIKIFTICWETFFVPRMGSSLVASKCVMIDTMYLKHVRKERFVFCTGTSKGR